MRDGDNMVRMMSLVMRAHGRDIEDDVGGNEGHYEVMRVMLVI
jgi:hypothetical protein